VADGCPREECIRRALDSHPEFAEARADVEKASAGVRLAQREYVPDVEAFARYSYQNNVPFLARNFGTFGIHFSYDLFDGGKKRAMLQGRAAGRGEKILLGSGERSNCECGQPTTSSNAPSKW
jgi:outer membrane protein TolC